MIKYTYNDEAIRTALNQNEEYAQFVQPGSSFGYIFIQVEDAHVVVYHNNNDTFSSFLLPNELCIYHNNVNDIKRIANIIERFAKLDYQTNVQSQTHKIF